MSSANSSIANLVPVDVHRGYPTDYVLARIHGRRAGLITDWLGSDAHNLAARWTDEQIWHALQTELRWLHAQCGDRLQRLLSPVFGLFEIKTLVLYLRSKALQRDAATAMLLERSLLDQRLKALLRSSRDVPSAVQALASALPSASDGFQQLPAAYAAEHLLGLENGLMRAYLEGVAAQRLHPSVRAFFSEFIDIRNAMILYKHRRWQIPGRPMLIKGGRVPASRVADPRIGSGRGRDSELSVETTLLRRLTKSLSPRRDDPVAAIVAYVWRVYVQTRNLAILHHAGDLDGATIEQELIA